MHGGQPAKGPQEDGYDTGTTEMISVNTDPPGAAVTFSHGGTCITPCNQEVKKKRAFKATL